MTMTAVFQGDNEQRVLIGMTRAHVDRLLEGHELSINAANHPGFPEGLSVVLIFEETVSELRKQFEPFRQTRSRR